MTGSSTLHGEEDFDYGFLECDTMPMKVACSSAMLIAI
jgi:hypothetical protein